MSTLETQYRKFLEANQKLKLSFEEWKKVNARLVKQALINMMKEDEDLGLYDEPFKHKVEVLSKEEVLDLCDKDNDYAKTWNDEYKFNTFVTPWKEE